MNQRMDIPASVVILTKNEERALPACLHAVRRFEEVVVLDSNSDDDTSTIAQRFGATIVNFSWNGQYPKKKQWALTNLPLRNDWVLMLDADEQPSEALTEELATLLEDKLALDVVGAVDIPLDYEWQGRLLRHGHRVLKRSVVHRGRCSFPVVDDLSVTNMWEVEGHYQPQTSYAVLTTRGRLLHRDPDPVHQWFSRHNRYSDWEAHLRRKPEHTNEVASFRSSQGSRFARIPFKPLMFFLYSFLLRGGFLDGRAGFDYAVAQSFYYWMIDVKTREMSRGSSAALR